MCARALQRTGGEGGQGEGEGDGGDEATCVEVSLSKPLAPGTKYELVLAAGARYNALSGPLQQDIRVSLGERLWYWSA